MKTITLSFLLLIISNLIMAQTKKLPIYGEVGMGAGQTLFFGNTKQNLAQAFGGSFKPGLGYNLLLGFFIAPEKWKGAGIGGRVKGSFGTSVKGEFGDSYLFNYYAVGIAMKYYPIYATFNKGLYLKAGVGFGQFTAKRANDAEKIYKHQYAIGSTSSAAIGWTFPIRKMALGVEAEFEFSNRNGTIDGKGEARFMSGQIGGNVVWSF